MLIIFSPLVISPSFPRSSLSVEAFHYFVISIFLNLHDITISHLLLLFAIILPFFVSFEKLDYPLTSPIKCFFFPPFYMLLEFYFNKFEFSPWFASILANVNGAFTWRIFFCALLQ